MKKFLKKVLPAKIVSMIISYKRKKQIKTAFRYDAKRYIKYSASLDSSSEIKLLGIIIKEYHIVEKGLTMPETRLGFGRELLLTLIKHCVLYLSMYGGKNEQVKHAIQVVLEYEEFHKRNSYILSNDIIEELKKLKKILTQQCTPAIQKEINREDFFASVNSSFFEFATSRSSVRNYTDEDVPVQSLVRALDLSKTTPSACNRQTCRTYIVTNKDEINDILEVQQGARGFGHLANKLIIITAEIGVFSGDIERYQMYIDGGIYTMNLLYALHYEKIAACVLNCDHSPEKDVKLRNRCKVKDSEHFIAMISCGVPPKKFKVALSKRLNIESTNTIL